MPSPLKKRKTKQKVPMLTHTQMGKRFRAVGRASAHLVGMTPFVPLKNPKGHKNDLFKEIVQQVGGVKKFASKSFGARYRKRLDRHDELVSTSSIRDLIAGILDEHFNKKFSPGQIADIGKVLDNLSRIRMPTEFVGYATASEVMQHPTSPGTGYFAEARKTASAHSLHDRRRREVVLQAMEEELQKKGDLQSIACAGARAAIGYTLNDMAAPVTADDVKPFSRKKAVPNEKLGAQIESRETMKDILVKLGGAQEANAAGESHADRLSRPWATRRGKNLRAASPSRRRPP